MSRHRLSFVLPLPEDVDYTFTLRFGGASRMIEGKFLLRTSISSSIQLYRESVDTGPRPEFIRTKDSLGVVLIRHLAEKEFTDLD